MASIGTLWSNPTYHKSKRVLAVASYSNVHIDLAANYTHFTDNKTPEFLAKFPLGKIPSFEGADGFKLFEASAIARYVASLNPSSGLLGASAHDEALVDQWVSFVETELFPYPVFVWYLCKGDIKPYSKPLYDSRVALALRALHTLEAHLSTKTFLVGERITLADITLASFLQSIYGYFVDAPLRRETPNVLRFYETVSNQPRVAEVFGKTEYCDKMIAGPPSK